jgi:SET domain-containing protein
MLLVKTYLDTSRIHGIGLFAAERIPEGTVIWRLAPAVDLVFDEDVLDALSPAARDQLRKYSYTDVVLRRRVLCCDDARFFNHSDAPNCLDHPSADGGTTVAMRDIEAGEELTCDYRAFDLDAQAGRHVEEFERHRAGVNGAAP